VTLSSSVRESLERATRAYEMFAPLASTYLAGRGLDESLAAMYPPGGAVVVEPNIAERFLSHIAMGNGCWEWCGARTGSGYGHMKIDGSMVLAHRISYSLFVGEPGEVVMHLCDNPACVRPTHLQSGTQLDNMRDKVGKDRGVSGGRPKLSVDQVLAIRKDPRPYSEVATEYGVGKEMIGRIKRGVSWTKV